MPNIELPEMGGIGDGLGDGIGGGFDMMPDLEQGTIFGGGMSIGNDLEGVIYDLKRDRHGRLIPDSGLQPVEKFLRSGWNPSSLSKYYKSPNKLYTPTIMIPSTLSHFGPWAFGDRKMGAYYYMLHYKGKLVHSEGGRFRFWGMGDNFLIVRVNGEVVLNTNNAFGGAWEGSLSRLSSYHFHHWLAWYGTWIDLEPGGPMLPIFKTAELTRDQVDNIYYYLWDDHLSVTNGPVFSDYANNAGVPEGRSGAENPDAAEEDLPLTQDRTRRWTLKSGEYMEG